MVAFLTRIKSNLPNHTYIILLPYYESSFDEYFIDQNAYFHILMWFNAILKQKKNFDGIYSGSHLHELLNLY